MKKVLLWAFSIFLLLSIVYLLGPKSEEPVLSTTLPKITSNLKELEEQIQEGEFSHPSLKPDNEARIVWADSSKKITEFSLVFLPGFSATQGEGDPIHRNFCNRFKCNAYLARLSEHGLDTISPMINLNADDYLKSAARAIAIGQQIGEKVIIMSSSTGGTLGLYLAAHHPEVFALICYSPNIEIYDPTAKLLTKPWGLEIARLVIGANFREYEAEENFKRYWSTKYRLEALVAVQNLVQHTMTKETFRRVKQPLFLGYYYKNNSEQDKVVKVDAMMEMYEQVSTPENLKRKIAFPEAGKHVLCSRHATKDYSRVQEETFKFAEEILGMTPMPN